MRGPGARGHGRRALHRLRLPATQVRENRPHHDGVFGVPTYEVDGELFWGADSIGFVNAFLADPVARRNDEIRRADALPVGAARKA
jgi:hypothetical protein